MNSLMHSAGPIHLGLDVSKNKIAVGVLRWGEQVPETDMIINDEASMQVTSRRILVDSTRAIPHSATRAEDLRGGAGGDAERTIWR